MKCKRNDFEDVLSAVTHMSIWESPRIRMNSKEIGRESFKNVIHWTIRLKISRRNKTGSVDLISSQVRDEKDCDRGTEEAHYAMFFDQKVCRTNKEIVHKSNINKIWKLLRGKEMQKKNKENDSKWITKDMISRKENRDADDWKCIYIMLCVFGNGRSMWTKFTSTH